MRSTVVLLALMSSCLAQAPKASVSYSVQQPSANVQFSRTHNSVQGQARSLQYPSAVTYSQPITYSQPAVQYVQRASAVQYVQPATHYVQQPAVRTVFSQPSVSYVQPSAQLIQSKTYVQPQTYIRPQTQTYVQPQTLRAAQPIAILRLNSNVNYDGNFNYDYETENGIRAETSGSLRNVPGSPEPGQIMQGSYSYTAPDGTPITTTWYADETGFHAEGAHLPVPPPVPEAIARSLEYIRSLPPSKESLQYN